MRVSVTHIIANPTGVWDVDGNAAIEKHGYASFPNGNIMTSIISFLILTLFVLWYFCVQVLG